MTLLDGNRRKPDLLIIWRSFRTAAWLGWQIESNWTDPFLFAVYTLIKPLASVMIIVIMYAVITHGDFDSQIFSYIFIGNAFYLFVGRVMNGMSWAVIDDREHYKTLKYIYTAPIHFPIYLIGRSVASLLAGLIAVIVSLFFGIAFLKVQISFYSINWLLFFITIILGIGLLSMMGLVLAGAMLLLAHHSFGVGEAVAGALYLFSGAIFPLEVLPSWLRWVGYIVPISYWLELIRRSLVGSVAQAFPTFQNLTDGQLLSILVCLTIGFTLFAMVSYRRFVAEARHRGLIDIVTNY